MFLLGKGSPCLADGVHAKLKQDLEMDDVCGLQE